MAGVPDFEVNLRIGNLDQVTEQLASLSDNAGRGEGRSASGSNQSTGLGQSIATGAATAAFGRLLDGIRSLETSIGSAFDANTTAVENQAAILEGLGATISPGIAAAIRGALGPQVESNQQAAGRTAAQLNEAFQGIALAQGPDATDAQIATAIQNQLGGQLATLSQIELLRSRGSVIGQGLSADAIDAAGGEVDLIAGARRGVTQAGELAEAVGLPIPGLSALLAAIESSTEAQNNAARAQEVAAESVQATGGPAARTILSNTGDFGDDGGS